MSAVLRPSQPPAALQQRAKHLPPNPRQDEHPTQDHPLECPRVRAGDKRAAQLLDEQMKKRGVSNYELAEVVGFSETIPRAMRKADRRKPFKVGHLYAFDRRLALALLDAVRVDLLTSNDIPHEE